MKKLYYSVKRDSFIDYITVYDNELKVFAELESLKYPDTGERFMTDVEEIENYLEDNGYGDEEFDIISIENNLIIMKNLTDEQLRDELSRRGFFTGNLWRVDDVKSKFFVSDDEAQEVLMESLTNDATMEQIWQSIDTFGEMKGYREVGSLQVGEFVLVPEPDDTDIHNHEFTGEVIAITNGIVTVEDGDGDCFDIEIERLKPENK